jgi:hypothetical protein
MHVAHGDGQFRTYPGFLRVLIAKGPTKIANEQQGGRTNKRGAELGGLPAAACRSLRGFARDAQASRPFMFLLTARFHHTAQCSERSLSWTENVLTVEFKPTWGYDA